MASSDRCPKMSSAELFHEMIRFLLSEQMIASGEVEVIFMKRVWLSSFSSSSRRNSILSMTMTARS